ncbi:hypothetical protein [Deinococcus sp.]|uniref:hypothetical protein n=1 Tax=Deinococcus sp. TaxID=47478 RepID=UPI003C79D85C
MKKRKGKFRDENFSEAKAITGDSNHITFASSLNAHGTYETMRFVLRLSPVNHELLNSLNPKTYLAQDISPEEIRSYSTYIHETIHWWQHMGSTSGLLFSLSYLAQFYSTMSHLRKVLENFGAKKSLLRWTDEMLVNMSAEDQIDLSDANIAVNNAIDIEFYKAYAFTPKENIRTIFNDVHFESIGHSYNIAYANLVNVIAETIDADFSILPDIRVWEDHFSYLRNNRHEGFYWDSPVHVPPIGLRAIFEGQARFSQLQFLNGVIGNQYSCEDLRDLGYFEGIYVEAFEVFLNLSDSAWPKNFDDPVIGLFLLICDIAINPTRGFPLDIEDYKNFIEDVDVGVRFHKLCLSIEGLPHLKESIHQYSKDEYFSFSRQICVKAGYDAPLQGLEAIERWRTTSEDFKNLMEEHRTFRFDLTNMPVRVFLSHFVSFSIDKLERPEFFCWPGKFMAGRHTNEEVAEFWLRHLSLFSDRPEKTGVYPRDWPDRDDADIREMFLNFYNSVVLYDLTRQWILLDGPFIRDYRWLVENYSQEKADEWSNNIFSSVYGTDLSDFEIIQP